MPEDKTKKLSDKEIADRNTARAKFLWRNGNQKWNKQARDNEAFRLNEQWEQDALDELGDRPSITVNLVFNIVELIAGQHLENEVDIMFKPTREAAGAIEVAEALTKMIRQTNDDVSHSFHETQMVVDGFTTGRAYLDLRMTNEDNYLGEPDMEAVSPTIVMPDTGSSSYDPRKWRDVVIHNFMSLDEIAEKYGDKVAQQLKDKGSSLNNTDYTGDTEGPPKQGFGDSEGFENDTWFDNHRKDEAGTEIYRIIERQHWKNDSYRHFMYPEGDIRPIPFFWPEDRVQEVAARHGLQIAEREAKRFRWTMSCGDVLIKDDWAPYRNFTLIPFFPYFHRGKTLGMVDLLRSVQELLNKTISQALHIVNTSANSGWISEENSLANMSDEEFQEKGAESGLHVVFKENKQAPQKITPNQIPSGIDRLMQIAENSIKEVSGASDQARGFAGAEVSGVAQDLKQRRFGVMLNRAVKNLDYSRSLYAQKMLTLYQDFYTEERTVMIAGPVGGQSPTPMKVNQQGSDGILNDLTLGEYGVVVSSTPKADTMRETAFGQAMLLRDRGVAIPDKELILLSDLPRKTEIAEEVATGGQAQPSASDVKREKDRFEAETAKIRAEAVKTEADAKLSLMKAAKENAELAEKLNSGTIGAQMDRIDSEADAEIEAKKLGMESPPEVPEIPEEEMSEGMTPPGVV